MTPPIAARPCDPAAILHSLRQSVHQALERKRLLHQYAVIWEDGRPRFIGPDAPETPPASDDSQHAPGGGDGAR